MVRINALLMAAVAGGLFLWPGVTLVSDLADPALRQGGISRTAWRLFRDLTPRYERWARERVASGKAEGLPTYDISGTEWPLFGTVFYLLAVDELQQAWLAERDRTGADGADGAAGAAGATGAASPVSFPVEPARFARGAIEASVDLLLDPRHATWVRRHWGDDYLHDTNCFYRMLLIYGTACHLRLTGDRRHEAVLRDQVATLARDIDRSPHGWLEDYPGETYPTDVLAAIAAIRDGAELLSSLSPAPARASGGSGWRRRPGAAGSADPGAPVVPVPGGLEGFLERARRGFTGTAVDGSHGDLPPYSGNAATGRPHTVARGCGVAYAVIFGRRVWPDLAGRWMDAYVEHFWQDRWLFQGFREYPKGYPGGDWGGDVDAGPIVAGHGVAACAFGVAAARASGRFDVAWPLTAEMLASCWPVADGTLLAPRVLSNAADAPLLGEACVLFCLASRPAAGDPISEGGELSGYVYILLALYVGVGTSVLCIPLLRRRRGSTSLPAPPPSKFQTVVWAVVLAGGVAALVVGWPAVAVVAILVVQLLPR